MPGVHCVGPVHVPRVEVPLGVRKASLSDSVVLARSVQRVVVVVVEQRRERSLVLLPPQMFGCAAHFPAGRVHPAPLPADILKEINTWGAFR